ncbi:MAG: 2-hydroxyacyl-CoA dehydratase [Deltaproteobacteria bacterium HGW-Deltaproteobacteria-7]|jgi:benzoyl-CoA reductase/2-hydroxyglutaryl-CoA dehydratase subunit BcrC/BadD/HgdB|nr:MAG: 2-hydroxyacyl-CoA dehydratase [Deltaproteobacteria bacterium HGW-Deltaproteobacteria-7]PKN53639.1 MAG: 2-hydroxyacyl-CoA dehydratase [Deltaproteobacteria bacterium HGW-Deltaproteobacteria-13]
MKAGVEPLVNDGFAGEATKRTLGYLQKQRETGKNIIGIYCGYAPLEVIRAMGAAPAVLCAFANKTIEAAETVLPANLCPLIKSSYGFIKTDTCPFFAISEAVIAETTCDGKKKMFELISGIKPMHVMDLPQLPDEKEALENWTVMIKKLKGFLETTFNREIDDKEVEKEIKETNIKNKLMNKIFDFAALTPTPVSWLELYDLTFLGQASTTKDMIALLNECVAKLERRVADGVYHGEKNSPRVLVTGCPVGGDATKVFKIIEESGGVVVALDSCTGMKAYNGVIAENTSDPYAALSRRYLDLPCSCMTPNNRRLTELDKMIARFNPDVVVDVVLHACHSYNVESHKIKEHVTNQHKMPFLKIETDYSQSDVEQIRTRVEALLETVPKKKSF